MEKSLTPWEDRIPKKTLIMYMAFFIACVLISIIDIYFNKINQLLLSVPIALVLLIAIISDRKVAHIPPLMVFAMTATLGLAAVSGFLQHHELFSILSSILTGVCLMMMGLVFVYSMIRSAPERYSEGRFFIYLGAFSIAMTVLLIMFVSECVYYHFLEFAGFELWEATTFVIYAMFGAAITAILSELGLDKMLVDSSINRSLETYADSRYSNDLAKKEALEIIASGESAKLEFKSTITTNIKTGENDKRMEKAVLKTIVAFLNTAGGILMIGVDDDGNIYGVDENEFPSRDKMNQHLSHMISSKIGEEFLAYISFRTIDMDDGKAIVRVDCDRCKKPVFLKDGKVEEFYVRSGPSSVILTGSNLVNYITNKSSKERQSMIKNLRILEADDL